MNSKKDYIYNFFKFLEEKEGKYITSPHGYFTMVGTYAPGKLTREEFEKQLPNVSLRVDYMEMYRPDLITLEDINRLPNDTGKRLVYKLKYLPDKVVPKDLKIPTFYVSDPKIKTLPKGLDVGEMYITHKSNLEELPQNLICGILGLVHAPRIYELPEDLIITKQLRVTPEYKGNIPKHLKSKVSYV